MATYYKVEKEFWSDFIKVENGEKDVITVWYNTESGEKDGKVGLSHYNGTTLYSEYTESSRTEFEIAKLKLTNYIEKL
jgi:hypothetical protein